MAGLDVGGERRRRDDLDGRSAEPRDRERCGERHLDEEEAAGGGHSERFGRLDKDRIDLAHPDVRVGEHRWDGEGGAVDLPMPSLAGPHQVDNAGIAVAALRAMGPVPAEAYAGLGRVHWPARMQRLHGRLAGALPPGSELWLDGGHNPGGGLALARHLRSWADRPVHLVVGMKQAKDTAEFLAPLLPAAPSLVGAVRRGREID